jgi:acetyl-CoA carboxylase carboxyltransferase component
MGSVLEVDDVIDPAETRSWIMRGLRMAAGSTGRPRREGGGKKRPNLDTW